MSQSIARSQTDGSDGHLATSEQSQLCAALNQLSMAGSHPTKWPFAAASFSASVYLARKATGLVQPMCWATVPVLKLPANLPSKWIWLRIVGLLFLNNENDTFSGSFGTPFLSYPPDLQCVIWNLKFPWSANICHHFPHLKAMFEVPSGKLT